MLRDVLDAFSAMITWPARVAFFFLISFFGAKAVDRSKFKTCDESLFCKRHRALQPGDSQFHVLSESVKLSESRLEAILNRTTDGRHFKLVVISLTDNRVRVTLDEVEPIRHRFIPKDALDGEPQEQSFKSHTVGSGSSMLITPDGNKVVLHYRPFRLDAYSGSQELVLSLNARGLLKYEEYRLRRKETPSSTTPEPTNGDEDEEQKDEDEGEGDANDEQEVKQEDTVDETQEEEGMWEEHWKSHHDSKPYGASSIGMDITMVGFEHVYGLPEHSDSFALKSTASTDPYRLYNLDVFEYELNCPMALYGSIPYMIAHSASKTIGVLWFNAAETWVDVRSSTADKGILRSLVDKFKSSSEIPQMDTHWISESGLIDIFLFLGPKPADLFRQYSQLTGVTPLPPMFSLGYHQCRWNYNDMEDVKGVDANFDFYDIPYDVIWLDIEHTDGKRYFTWDPIKFSKPTEMIEGIAEKHRKMVVIIDPHIKRDDNYKVYKEAKDSGYFVKTKDGQDYEGHCWPGASMYLDFLNPVVREYWAGHFAFDKYEGSTENLFVWNDMNEPSVFSGPEITMHKDAKHMGDWEHRDIHNMYGFYHHMSTWQGLLSRSNNRLRPFVLTRAFFIGSQRYGSVWTGDNAAQWSHLQASVPMLLSLSVSGVPFVGADVGGFFGNPDEELLVRWYQAGAFQPFFRAHAHIDTKRREPWLFSEDARLQIREAIRKRCTLLTYWYTLFYEHSKTGMPVMRPIWLEFQEDKFGFDEEKEFLIGSALLVRPVMDPGAHSVSVYLPGENSMWYDFDTFRAQPGPGAVYVQTPMNKIPVFIRGGSIIPLRGRVRRASMLQNHDPITLYVALNNMGDEARGTLYLDDGETFAYKTGQYLYREFVFQKDTPVTYSLSCKNLDHNGKLQSDVWVEKVVLIGVRFWPTDVHLFVDDYTPTFLKYEFSSESSTLTIRKPEVLVGKDWRIDIHA